MQTTIKSIVAFACMFCLQNSTATAQASAGTSSTQIPVTLDSSSVPSGLAEFGSRGKKTIRVTVYGQVNQPGIYHLPQGALVRDALHDAHGLKELFWWRMSYIKRSTSSRSQSTLIRFQSKNTWQEVSLQEGDLLYLGYEVY